MDYTKGKWRYTIIGLESKVVDDKVNIIAHIENRNTLEEIEANAQLIASAPDLYEALKEVRKIFEALDYSEDSYSMGVVDKALAKAEEK